jgi:hypothetical protein
MEDVWVKRINAISDGIAKVVIAAASIIAAWQSISNHAAIKAVEAKQDHQIQVMGTR